MKFELINCGMNTSGYVLVQMWALTETMWEEMRLRKEMQASYEDSYGCVSFQFYFELQGVSMPRSVATIVFSAKDNSEIARGWVMGIADDFWRVDIFKIRPWRK